MDDVRKPSAEAEELHQHCAMIDALMGGTAEMRKAGARFLPQWPGEPDAAYKARLGCAVLFPAYARTVSVLVGKPFSKSITIGDDVPPAVRDLMDDVDGEGRNLDAFAATAAHLAMAYGFAGILADMPPNPGARTVAEERRAGLRPYLTQYRPHDVLGWRVERRGPSMVLTQLRLLERVTEPDGPFGTKRTEQVRVLEPGRWQTWRPVRGANGAEEWRIHEEGTTTLGDVIPFVPVYGFRAGFMVGRPPMLELAHMNVEHWQSASDQQTILHVARVPILFGRGFAEGESIIVGVNSFVSAANPQAELRYVEHSGAAIEAGRKSLLDLEDRMRQAGAELLVIKPGNVTVAQTLADNEPAMCDLQRIVQALENALDQSLDFLAAWMNLGEDAGGHVQIFKDFGAATMAEASAQILSDMEARGGLSRETTLHEFKRRGLLAPEVDVAEELERIASERAARQAGASEAANANGGNPPGNAGPGNPAGGTGGTAQQ